MTYRADACPEPAALFQMEGAGVFTTRSGVSKSYKPYFRAMRLPGTRQHPKGVWELYYFSMNWTIQDMIWVLLQGKDRAIPFPRGRWSRTNEKLCPDRSLAVRKPWLPTSHWKINVTTPEGILSDPLELRTVMGPSPDGPIPIHGTVEKIALWFLCGSFLFTPVVWLFPRDSDPRLSFGS